MCSVQSAEFKYTGLLRFARNDKGDNVPSFIITRLKHPCHCERAIGEVWQSRAFKSIGKMAVRYDCFFKPYCVIPAQAEWNYIANYRKCMCLSIGIMAAGVGPR